MRHYFCAAAHTRIVLAAAFVSISFMCQAAQAAYVGYNFTATAFPATQPPFGISLSTYNPVSGQFIYDTSSLAQPVSGCATCSEYRQQYPGGFHATFNTMSVSADEYVVIVRNNVSGGTTDTINILWVSDLTPPLPPLTVQGVPRLAGLFRINLSGPMSVFPNSSLPSTLNLANFTNRFSFLADTPTGIVDVPFNITSLVQVAVDPPPASPSGGLPEPSARLMLILGLAGFFNCALVRRRAFTCAVRCGN